MARKRILHHLCLILTQCLLLPSPATAATFAKGSLIIPMDTSYQDSGMLKAYGLLYQVLKADVPVHWVIKSKKKAGEADFTVAATDFASGAAVSSHGYRGGPFVIEAAHAAKAGPVITAWQKSNTTAVHLAAAAFEGRTSRLLTAAPSIAVIADKNEDIAFSYLNAAGIPDSKGAAWTKGGADLLSIAAIAGPTTTRHDDGALFRPSGQPAYCQIMTMHWGVKEVVDEVVAEYRAFLTFPTHMMAECQAVNAIENNVNGRFLTYNGFLIDNNVKETGPFSFLNQDTPFVQMDGAFSLVGGSERSYSLPAGDKFRDRNVVMIKDASSADGIRSIWMTGYIDGKCAIPKDDVGVPDCKAGVGKISYLGGHKYEVALPISKNPKTQGCRLFLNSLFEAGCATAEGQPKVGLNLSGPSWTTTGKADYTLTFQNQGPGSALEQVLTYKLPAGATYASSSNGGVAQGSVVTWKAGDLGPKKVGSVQVSVTFASHGVYQNTASLRHEVGLNTRTVASNTVATSYQATAPDGGSGSRDGGGGFADGGGDGRGAADEDGCNCSASSSNAGPFGALTLLLCLLLAGASRTRLARRSTSDLKAPGLSPGSRSRARS